MPNFRLASILMSFLTLLAGCGICPMFEDAIFAYTGVGTSVPNTDDLKGFSTTRPQIEAPLNNSEVPLLPLDVKSYAFHWLGITKAELVVNGVTVRTDPVTPEPDPEKPGYYLMSNIVQQWVPPAPGPYYLQVRVTNGGGDTEITYPVLVYVGGVATLDFTQIVNGFTATAAALTGTAPATTNTATATATPSPTVGASPTQPRITFTPSLTPSRTSTVQATATLTPTLTSTVALGAPFTTFSADSTSINAGQCTTLHWNSGNITAIFLNNEGTVGTLDKQVCPTVTTLYRLRATTQSSGDIVKEITITVTGSANTATSTNTGVAASTATHTATSTNVVAVGPPEIGSLGFSTTPISNHTACGGNSVIVSVSVTNAINVTLYFSAAGGSGSKGMSNQGGNNWATTVSVDDGLDLPSTAHGPIQFSVEATGPGGGAASNPTGGVNIITCES